MPKDYADRIISLVDRMRNNSQEMLFWKNMPLAREAFSLLESLDDPAESPLDKALACEAIVSELSEYDIPRFTLGILRRELSWLNESEEQSDSLTADDVRAHISRLEDWISPERIGNREFMRKYGRHLASDPVERSPLWEELYVEVEEECDRQLGDVPRGMGFCFSYWSTKRAVLAKKGVEWKDPHIMNPGVMFD